MSRTTYDNSQPVQLARYVYRADRLRLRHEMGSFPLTRPLADTHLPAIATRLQ